MKLIYSVWRPTCVFPFISQALCFALFWRITSCFVQLFQVTAQFNQMSGSFLSQNIRRHRVQLMERAARKYNHCSCNCTPSKGESIGANLDTKPLQLSVSIVAAALLHTNLALRAHSTGTLASCFLSFQPPRSTHLTMPILTSTSLQSAVGAVLKGLRLFK